MFRKEQGSPWPTWPPQLWEFSERVSIFPVTSAPSPSHKFAIRVRVQSQNCVFSSAIFAKLPVRDSVPKAFQPRRLAFSPDGGASCEHPPTWPSYTLPLKTLWWIWWPPHKLSIYLVQPSTDVFFCYIVCFQTICKHGGIRSVDQVIRWKITNTLNLTQIPSFDLQDFLPSSKCNDQETDACSSLVFSQPIHQERYPLRWRSS